MFVYIYTYLPIYTHTYTRKCLKTHACKYIISKDRTVAFLGGRGREGPDLG